MILSALLTLFLTSVSLGSEPICSNLSAVTCTEGERNDGTGSTALADSTAFVKKEFERLNPSIRQTFEQLLETGAGREMVPLVVDACRLHEMKDCKKTSAPNCKKMIVTCLTRLFKTTEIDPQLEILYSSKEEMNFFDAEAAINLVLNPTYKRAIKQISLNNSVSIPAELKRKVEFELFPTVQNLLRQKIRELPIDEQTRAKMDRQIASAKFAGVQCKKENPTYSTELADALFPNAHYDEDTHTFAICPAYLRYSSSEFDLTAMIAHELAHSIDPCRLAGGASGGERRAMSEASPDKVIEDRYLRKDFISCLRSSKSSGAKSFRPFNPPIADSDEMVGNDLSRLCQHDQINESVADWFAAETLAAYIPLRNSKISPKLATAQIQSGVANVFRSFCSSGYNEENSTDVHPATHRRLNSMFLTQPKLRTMMGCPAEVHDRRYCDIQNPASLSDSQQPASKPTTPVTSEAQQ